MRKTILNILIVVFAIFFIIAVLYFFTGSLEMYPTIEQEEKAKGVAIIIALICAFVDVILIKLRKIKRNQ